MKNIIRLTRTLIFLALSLFLIGFFICTTSPDNVFIGISIMGVGVMFVLLALIPISQQNIYKEDRIKKLEEEVELLKKKNFH